MNTWTFDITRQSDWDLWVLVCAAAAFVLICYAVFGKLWTHPRGWIALGLGAAGVIGTVAILALPGLRTARVGLVWTFVLLCLLSATFYLELRTRLTFSQTAILLTLRVLALALLVPMLFEPVLRYVTRPKPERPMLFLVDASGSMSFSDVQNGPTRIQSIWQTLRPQLDRVNENFIPRFFTFSTALNELAKPDDLAALHASGQATDIAGGINALLSKVTADDAAVVVFSDGIDNTSPNVPAAIRASRLPLHTVRVGSEQAEPSTVANIAVTDIAAAEEFVVNNQTPVTATVKSTALANRVVEVKLAAVDAKGTPLGKVETAKLVLQPSVEGQKVELPFKPGAVGVHRLAVWVDPVVGERSTVDNRQEFQGLAIDPRIKVLYVEGRARPEYRPLKRALEADSNVELATLIRLKKEQFAAGGSVDGEKLKGMPTSPEQWAKFDVIIIGDLDSSFLPPGQQARLEQRVIAGGALLMLGGQNSFGRGGYKDTPIEKVLPVFVGERDAPQETEKFVPRLTPEGSTHPAMEGLLEWFGTAEAPATKKLPPLNGNVIVGKEKTGAQVLLVHAGRPGPRPSTGGQIVLAVQRYGEGRSGAFTADTTHLWSLPLRGLGQDSPYNRFWGQLVRWLAGADVRNRQRGAGIEGLLNKTVYGLGENVRVRAMVRDERGDATRYATVALKLKPTGGQPDGAEKSVKDFALDPVETYTGMYQLVIPNPDKGDYEVELVATKDGKELGRQSLKFTVIPPADEMLKIAANPSLLAAISSATGGSHYDLGRLPALIDELIRTSKHPVAAKEVSVPLANVIHAGLAAVGQSPTWSRKFDLPMQGMLVVALLAAEWIMRRRWQLA